MTDAVKSVANYTFKVLGLNRIEIRACTNNMKSRAIPHAHQAKIFEYPQNEKKLTFIQNE
jgi:RimJ/RimL family protein N-acetyltransferase